MGNREAARSKDNRTHVSTGVSYVDAALSKFRFVAHYELVPKVTVEVLNVCVDTIQREVFKALGQNEKSLS